MTENRKSPRYRTLARAKISSVDGKSTMRRGANEGETLLKDLSITGCCVECTVYPDVKTGEKYSVNIIPETAANLGHFTLTVEAKWIHLMGYSCEIGFSVLESPKGKEFLRYVDYLAWRAEAGLDTSIV
jgi:hypothetical protein